MKILICVKCFGNKEAWSLFGGRKNLRRRMLCIVKFRVKCYCVRCFSGGIYIHSMLISTV